MSNRVTYSGCDFSALVTAKWNYTFIDGTPRSYFGRFNNIADLDYWTPTNPTNKNPAPTTGGVGPPATRRRVSTPMARTGAFATSRSATRSTRALARQDRRAEPSRSTARRRIRTSTSSYIGIDPEVGGAVPTIRTLLLGTNIIW